MEGKISVEEGLATGIVLTAEEGQTVVEALRIMGRHAEGIRNSGRPNAVEASEIIAEKLVPVGELLLMMVQSGLVQRHD